LIGYSTRCRAQPDMFSDLSGDTADAPKEPLVA
jgi:hypothetical protein